MAKQFKYIHKGKIANWHEGLMLGNGSFGALIYGDKNIFISLDRIDLWDNRPAPELKEKGFNYLNMIKTCKEDWDEYLRLFDNCYNHPYPTKLNAGSIIINQEVTSNDMFSLDISNGEFDIQNGQNNYYGYLDANHDILVVFMPKTAQISLKMPGYLSNQDKKSGLGYPLATEGKNGEFKYIIQPTKCGFSYAILMLDTTIDNKRAVLTTVVKGKDINIAIDEGKLLLQKYRTSIREHKKQHDEYWKRYFSTSSVTTNNEKIDRLYNFGRYFFACNSKGKYPMSLEGVWTRNDGKLPPWKGDYHMDINLEMSYESYMKTGNRKEGKVLVDYLWNNRRAFAKLAKSFCHTDGYFIPGVMSQNCTPLGGWPMYALNPANAIWISSAFDNYYRYYGDINYLKNRAFPFLQNIEKCISALLTKNEDGKLQFEISASPEINDCNKDAILKHQSNFELAMLHYLYRTLIDYSNTLGLDDSYYKKQQSMLADYYKNAKGEMMISQDLDYKESHRHFSHILSHKNLENLNPYKDKDQILKDFNRLEKYGHDQWVGFSFTEASSLASYIGLGEEAFKLAYAFADGFVNDNGFHMNMDFNHKGYSTIESYAFTLEANMGFVRAITDMMLRTTDDVITIFPTLSKELKAKGVSFNKLRAYNKTTVSGKYKNGLKSFSIKVNKPRTIKLFNNIGESFDLVIDGKKQSYNCPLNQIIVIPVERNIKYIGK